MCVNDLGCRTGEEQVGEISHPHTIDSGRVEMSKNVDCSQEGLVSTDHTSGVAKHHLQGQYKVNNPVVHFVGYLVLEYKGPNNLVTLPLCHSSSSLQLIF